MAIKEVLVPDIGNFDSVDVIEVHVKAGDSVNQDDSLITLESDKASMDIPAPFAGTVKEVRIKVGDKASQGILIALVESAEGTVATPPPQPAAAAPTPAAAPAAPSAPVQAPPAAIPQGGGTQEVRVPDIGNFDSVDVIEVHVKAGDSVNADDSLITLESDKASMDIPAPFAGTVKEVQIKVGDKASQGTLIAVIEAAGGAAVAAQPAASAPVVTTVAAAEVPAPSKPVPEVPKPIAPQGTPNPVAARAEFAPGKNPHASPSVRKFARELGADLTRVAGSGPKGRISKEDVQAWVKGELTKPRAEAAASGGMNVLAMPTIDFSQFGATETKALPRIKKISGANLHRNWVTAPHVTQFDNADITDLEDFRKSMQDEAAKRGVKLTMLAFLMKAVVNALRAYPSFNASLSADGSELILKQYYNIGFACDTPDGLVVPVIRDVNQKDVLDIARELGELSARARERKLKVEEMQGGCFTISSLGGIGGTAFTPIINCPEVAILGVSRSSIEPVWDAKSKTFEPRLLLPLSLSYDHRVIDGADGARFTSHLRMMLSDVRRLLL